MLSCFAAAKSLSAFSRIVQRYSNCFSGHKSDPVAVGEFLAAYRGYLDRAQQPRLQPAHHLSAVMTSTLDGRSKLQQPINDVKQQQRQEQQQQQQHATQQQDWTPQQQHFMQLAFEQARIALRMREVPIGCVIVKDGKVIGSGYNLTNHTRNATRHAEMEAIDRILADHGGDVAKADFGSCQLFVTIEPCIMCAAALSLLGFGKVYYGAGNDKFGGCGSILSVHQSASGCCSGSEAGAPHGKPFPAQGGLFADQAIQLLQQFYVCGNPLAPKPKRAVVENPPWEQDAAPQQQQQQPPGVASLLCQLQPAAEQQQEQQQGGCCEVQKQEQLQLPLSPRQQPHVGMLAAT